MNAHGEGESPYCYFHPKELVVGVCALCLKERLLILASKQGELPLNNEERRSCRILRRKSSIPLPKVFALGSFLQRLDSRHHRPGNYSGDGSVASLEDSFISIKFEDNGNPSWDNKKKTSIDPNPEGDPTAGKADDEAPKSVVEHVKRGGGVLRWRKQVSRVLQLARWKRPNKAVVCHVGLGGKVESRKGRRGWIRRLTRRKPTAT